MQHLVFRRSATCSRDIWFRKMNCQQTLMSEKTYRYESISCSMKWNFFLLSIGIWIAIGLFYYGINVPFIYRVRGDAAEYLNIANQFTSFGDAFHYVGARTLGLPLFDFLFLYLDTNSDIVSKVNHICLALFIIHELTVFLVCFSCVRCRLFTSSSVYFYVLFFLLATYPAMVMHTTTPLTDVLGMDLLLIGFSLFAWVAAFEMPWAGVVLSGVIGGAILSYAILVRPAYWIGVVGFLMIYLLMTGVNRWLARHANSRQLVILSLVISLTIVAIVFPVMDNCKARYQTLCIQNPYTFNSIESVKAGLTSARTVWNHSPTPFYPDDFLVKHFQNRCPVTSVIGHLNRDNSNLLSCLFYSPGLAGVYFIKKLTGLFDTFRMTPYTETVTPEWYCWLSRAFSSVALVGFWILLWEGLKGGYQLIVHRRPISSLMTAAWFFCMIQVSVQSILHVEERYALPWIPFCIIAFVLKIQEIQDTTYPAKLRWLWVSFIILIILGYFIQVLVWDYGIKN